MHVHFFSQWKLHLASDAGIKCSSPVTGIRAPWRQGWFEAWVRNIKESETKMRRYAWQETQNKSHSDRNEAKRGRYQLRDHRVAKMGKWSQSNKVHWNLPQSIKPKPTIINLILIQMCASKREIDPSPLQDNTESCRPMVGSQWGKALLPTSQMETVHSHFLIKATVGSREREWLYYGPTLPQPGRDGSIDRGMQANTMT